MENKSVLNHGWLTQLANPHHDGTMQQIDDFLQSFASDNQVFNQKKAAVHQCRQNEDEVWIKSQRDPAVKNLENADKKQDSCEMAGRYILQAHAQLPDDEATKAEAQVCQQIIKDAKVRHATDQAIADMYKTIMAMMDLMPSAELTALYTQLKGIELYARSTT